MTTLLSCDKTAQSVAHWVRWIQQHHPALVQQLRTCNHHYNDQYLNTWHLEGDVWTHTMLVLQSYGNAGVDDVCIGLTALLHDIGKPSAMCARHDRHRYLFKGHESVSAWIAWRLLSEEHLGLTREQRLTIFSLVALHGSLYLDWFQHNEILDHQRVARAFYGFGDRFWQRLIAQIQNDMQGQITTNPNQKADLLLMSSDVLGTFAQLRQDKNLIDDRISCTFLVGLPGSGKSSFYQQQHNTLHKTKLLSRDDLLHQITGESDYRKAWQQQDKNPRISKQIDQQLLVQFEQAIAQQYSITIDMTNLSRKSRAYWLSRLPETYRAEALIFITDDDTLYQRNRQRGHKYIPDQVIHDMMLRFEHPLFDEFDQIDYVINGQRYALPTD